MPIRFPEDLVAFLDSAKPLEYDELKAEPGRVQLVKPEDIKLETVWISCDEYPNDPNHGVEGLYRVSAVNLIAEAEHYDPGFILLWLTEQQRFGTWDCDHYKLWMFADASWSDICLDPLSYLNAQWYPSEVAIEVTEPWRLFPFVPGEPDRG